MHVSVTVPILLLVFRRAHTTRAVVDALREVRPERIFVAANAPGSSRAEEVESCAAARAVVGEIDWPCRIERLYREVHLGCRESIASAISWFFEQVEEGIVLEDDCVPAPDFFPYCSELLERYRDDARVMGIAGDNTLRGSFPAQSSYDFCRFPLIWGWASWARAWRHYDEARFREGDWDPVIRSVDSRPAFREAFQDKFARTASGELDTWDYIWNHSVWARGGLWIVPEVNLISNIGFGSAGTHARNALAPRANRPTAGLRWPLRHPAAVHSNRRLGRAIARDIHDVPEQASLLQRVWRRLKAPALA